MSRSEGEEMERVHVHIYREDAEKVRALFGDNLGFSKAIRIMIRKFLRTIEEKAEGRRVETNLDDLIKDEN